MFLDEWYGVVSLISVFFFGMTSLVYTTCVGVRRSRCNVIKCGNCILCLREIMTKDEMLVDGVITNKEGEQRIKEKELELRIAQAKQGQSPMKEEQTVSIENRLMNDLHNINTIVLEMKSNMISSHKVNEENQDNNRSSENNV